MSRADNARVSSRPDAASGRVSAWTLAADLVPETGVDALQSENVRALARKAMSGTPSRNFSVYRIKGRKRFRILL